MPSPSKTDSTRREARRRAARRVARLTRVLAETTRSEDARALLDELVDDALALTGAERGLVLLADREGRFDIGAARDRAGAPLPPDVRYSTTVARRVYGSGRAESLLIGGENWDPKRNGSVAELRLRHVLCAPLRSGRRTVGVLYADSRVSATGFARPDLDLFAALAAQCALALERAERQRLELGQREARDVQRAMLPARTVVGSSVEVAGLCRPRDEAGGDYFDLIPLGGERIAVVLADAAGHGLAAALCMSAARSLLRTFLPRTNALHRVLAEVNRALARDMPAGTFMSLFLGELDLRSGSLRYASAGHNAAVVSRAVGACEELAPTGPALAVLPDAPYGTAAAEALRPDDLLLLYTDGIPEARGPQRELFGMRRLKRTLLACRGSSAPEIVGTISRAITSFTGAAGPEDDLSLVVAKGHAA